MKKLFYILMFFYPVVVGAQQGWYKSYPSYNWVNVGNPDFSSGAARDISLAFSPIDHQPYVAFVDCGNNFVATVMTFDGTIWKNVGNAAVSPGEAAFTSLAFSPIDFQPYVAFSDWGQNGKASVMKYDGISNWVNVGSFGFSAGTAMYISLAFDPSDGNPTVSYTDDGNFQKATVMKYDGISSWMNYGAAGFSAGLAYFTSLAFNPIDYRPYVAYSDFANNSKASVMENDGTGNWVNVGSFGFSAGRADYTSLAFSPIDDQPYVAYSDFAYFQKTTVMKYDGISSWINVGTAGFSAGQADYTSLAFSPTDHQPYVAYSDFANLQKATVMKFDGTSNSWVNVGNAGFSTLQAYFTSLAFSPIDFQPYVAFSDTFATVMYYNAPTGIDELRQSQLSIYPTPATDKVNIETFTKGSITLLNLNGQQLLQQEITEPTTIIDISGLKSGVYFVRLTSDRTVAVGKFVKK